MVTLKAAKSLKQKKCKECGNVYTPERSLQSVCSPGCAIARARKTREKQVKREIRDAKEKGKTRREWIKYAQTVFNTWVRERDYGEPCISCQRHHSGQYHAGHYRTTKAAPELRFEPLNVHKQCSVCNNHLSGNLIEYRINLIKKIGIESVEWLEGKHEPKHYSIDDLKELIEEYKLKTKLLKTTILQM